MDVCVKTNRYIPGFSTAGLIHKAQAMQLDLTNLLSYLFSSSTIKQLIAFSCKFRAQVEPVLWRVIAGCQKLGCLFR